MSRYAEVDGAILAFLKGGAANWCTINFAMQSKFHRKYWTKRMESWRVIDRRLQSLRRAGKIATDHKGSRSKWSLA